MKFQRKNNKQDNQHSKNQSSCVKDRKSQELNPSSFNGKKSKLTNLQCFTHSDFGHSSIVCKNKKKVGRVFNVTLGDIYSEQENASELEDGKTNNHAFTTTTNARFNDFTSSSDEENEGENSSMLFLYLMYQTLMNYSWIAQVLRKREK